MADLGYVMWRQRLGETEDGRKALAALDAAESQSHQRLTLIRELQQELAQTLALNPAEPLTREQRVALFLHSLYFDGSHIDHERVQEYADHYADRRWTHEHGLDRAGRARFIKRVTEEALCWSWTFVKQEYKDTIPSILKRTIV